MDDIAILWVIIPCIIVLILAYIVLIDRITDYLFKLGNRKHNKNDDNRTDS